MKSILQTASVTISFLGLSLVNHLHAATHAVLPGASIQAKIDIAVAGDIVAIFGGTYSEDLTINKAIRLVEVNGQQVILTGNVTFTGVANCPIFDGFTVGSAGRGISVADTTGLVFQNLDARNGSGITTSGTTHLKITNSQLSSLTPGSTTVEVTKTSLTGDINQTAGSLIVTSSTVAGNFNTQSTALKTVAFRTVVSGDCNWRAKKNWLGYAEARSFNFTDQNSARITLVGSKFNRQNNQASGLNIGGANNNFLILNNNVTGIQYNAGPYLIANGLTASGAGNSYNIYNNCISMSYINNGFRPTDVYETGNGIHISDSNKVVILNNIITGAKNGVNALFGAVVKNNLYWHSISNGREGGGVVAEGTLYSDPLFVTDNAPTLQPSSPCINAGTADPRYNNRDGTRNTIGPSGGPWIDPDGWTTENPVVISFDLTPDMVLEGVDTEVIISEGQAVSAP